MSEYERSACHAIGIITNASTIHGVATRAKGALQTLCIFLPCQVSGWDMPELMQQCFGSMTGDAASILRGSRTSRMIDGSFGREGLSTIEDEALECWGSGLECSWQ